MATTIRLKKKSATLVIKKDGAQGEWMYSRQGREQGPMTLPELRNAVGAGQLGPDDEVWRIDNPARARAGWLPWLFSGGACAEVLPAGEVEPLVCPACQARFLPEDALFVAHHPDLPHDLLLGPGNPYRFRPCRFTAAGEAIDPAGEAVNETACPACHARLQPPPPTTAPGPRPAARPARDKDAPERLPPQLATPEGVRQLVADIRGILSRTGSARMLGDVVARQYAELCRRASARLDLCARFLANGQRHEAYDQATQPPPLLQLCEQLPFPELDQWQQLCARSRWAVPPAIDTTAMAAVEAACREAAPFEPALRALRRAVRRGDGAGALRVLRTLMLMDGENLNWSVDVAAFEEVRQEALFAAAVQAIEAGDLEALRPLAIELLGLWISPPEAHPLAIVRAEFSRLGALAATQRSQALAEAFATACDRQDLVAATEADAGWKALLAEGHVPDEAARQTFASGQSWFTAAAARQAADAGFARDLQALRDALAQPRAADAVEGLLRTLAAGGRELPADVRRSAERVIQRRAAIALGRRRLRAAGRAAAIVLPVLVLAGAGWIVTLRHQRHAWTARLEDVVRGGDLAAFDQAVGELRNGYGRIFGGGLMRYRPVATLIARRPELAARLANRAVAYDESLARLRAIQAAGFDAPAGEVLNLLAQGRAAARSGDIGQLDALMQVETPWRADQTARLTKLLAQLPITPPSATVFSTEPFGAATRKIAEYCGRVQTAAGLAGADEAVRRRLEPFLPAAADCRARLEPRLAALRAAEQATNLDLYLDALVRYADRYTNDTLSAQMADAMGGRKEYRAALAANGLRARRAAEATPEAWAAVRKALSSLQETRALNELRWATRRDNGELVFVMGHEKPEAGFHGRWAECYQPQTGDQGPAFKRARVVDDAPYRDGFSDAPSRGWAHTELVRNMISDAFAVSGPAAGATYLESHIRAVGAMPVWNGSGAPGSNDLPNVAFKVQYLVFMLEQMKNLSQLPEWKQMLDELRGADNAQANWICHKSGEVRQINRDGAKALTAIFGPKGWLARLDVRRAAEEQVEQVPLVWAGYVDFGSPERIVCRLAATPSDFAVLGRDANRQPVLSIAGFSRMQLQPGEPVLAWSDGHRTMLKLAAIAAAVHADAETVSALVPSWFPR